MSLVAGAIVAGKLTVGSMAEAIYAELESQVPLRANEDPIARQRLVIAIATGVINHLKAKHDAFTVTVPDPSGGPDITRTIDIA